MSSSGGTLSIDQQLKQQQLQKQLTEQQVQQQKTAQEQMTRQLALQKAEQDVELRKKAEALQQKEAALDQAEKQRQEAAEAQEEKAPDYVMSSSNIDTSPSETLRGYFWLCTLFKYYLILLWATAFAFLVAALCIGYDYNQESKFWSKLTKAENEAFYYAAIVFSIILGIYVIYTIWLGSIEIDGEINTKGVIGSSLDVVRDVSLMYQNKQSKGLMHRGIASLFSTQNTTIPTLERHFRNGKIGKVFTKIEDKL